MASIWGVSEREVGVAVERASKWYLHPVFEDVQEFNPVASAYVVFESDVQSLAADVVTTLWQRVSDERREVIEDEVFAFVMAQPWVRRGR